MKKYLILLLASVFIFTGLLSCSDDVSGDDDDVNDVIDFYEISGKWENEDSTASLQINDAGQTWVFSGGEMLFRGYLKQIELGADDPNYDYSFRFDLYRDDETLMMCYFYDVGNNKLIEKNTAGDMTDRYHSAGEFNINESETTGNWFIHGVADSYCLKLNIDNTWALTYPGADGEVLCSGSCGESPFGDIEFDIDTDNNISLGSAEFKDGNLIVGVSSTSPCQLEPYTAYLFYSEEVSYPRTSVGNYVGWWQYQNTFHIEVLDDGTWYLDDSPTEESAGGTYEATENGLILKVEQSDNYYFGPDEVLEFTIQPDGTIYNDLTTYTLIPRFSGP